MMKPELFWLILTTIMTGLFWVPYILDRMAVRGFMGAMANPDPSDKPQSAWAERAKSAHHNAVENLVVFTALVAAALFANVSNHLTVLGCEIYFWARLVHYLVYTAGIPVVRTLSFLTGVAGQVLIAIALLQAL